MASPTLKTPVTVELTYHFDTKTISFPDHLHGKKNPHNLEIKNGERLIFTCKQGPLHLLFSPDDLFNPPEFHTGDDPVEVKRALHPHEKAMIQCGGTFQDSGGTYPASANDTQRVPKSEPTPKEITIDPATQGYGVGVED